VREVVCQLSCNLFQPPQRSKRFPDLKHLFQPFQPFNRYAPFKSLKLTESVPCVPAVQSPGSSPGLFKSFSRLRITNKVAFCYLAARRRCMRRAGLRSLRQSHRRHRHEKEIAVL